jgi:hypothetical protein
MMAGADRLSHGQVLQNRVKHKNVHRLNSVKKKKKNFATAVKKGRDGWLVPQSRVEPAYLCNTDKRRKTSKMCESTVSAA